MEGSNHNSTTNTGRYHQGSSIDQDDDDRSWKRKPKIGINDRREKEQKNGGNNNGDSQNRRKCARERLGLKNSNSQGYNNGSPARNKQR